MVAGSLPRWILALVLALGALTTAGCAGQPESTPSQTSTVPAPEKSGDGAIRSDPEPITSRFPALASLTSVAWMSGTLGDDRVPGPSTYWIDAVIELTPADAEALRAGGGELTEGDAPDLEAPLLDLLPEGRLLTSDALSAEVSSPDHPATAWLVGETDTLVLTSRFD